MEAIFFALISYFGWGIGSVFSTISARKLGGFSTIFWLSLVGLLLTSWYIPFALDSLKNLTLTVFSISIIVGLLGWIGGITGYEAVRLINPALAISIEGSYPILSVILSLIIFKESITPAQIISIVVIFIGIIIMTWNFQQLLKGNSKIDKGIFLALVTLVCYGFYGALIKIPVHAIGWFWPVYFSLALLPLFYFYAKWRHIEITGVIDKRAFLPVLLTVVLFRTAEFSYNLGISQGLVSIVAPIAGANPTLFVILAFLFFKDPITRQQIAGIITTLIGIVLLSIFSV